MYTLHLPFYPLHLLNLTRNEAVTDHVGGGKNWFSINVRNSKKGKLIFLNVVFLILFICAGYFI